MKKQLLITLTTFTALAVTSQNVNKSLVNGKIKMIETFKSFTSSEPINKQNTAAKSNKKMSVAPYPRIGGSTNVIGVQSTEGRALTYNAAVNTVGMVIRKQAGWTIPVGDNSGTIAYAYSTNLGLTWDSTIVIANASKLMRHPGGTIYNPSGNTNPANAYAVASGPWHPGASWQGNYFASKQLSFPGNNTNGSSLFVDNLNLGVTPGQKKQDFTRTDMQATTDGKVHVLGGLFGDINGTTALAQAFRGVMLNTGTFNAGSFTWTLDSLKPSFKSTTSGNKHSYSSFNQSWSEDGQIGYVVFNGVDINAPVNSSMNTYQPYVYKTVNGGASWSRHAPLFDFTTIPAIADRTYPTWSGLVKPFISLDEGSSATVDANGDLHFFASLISSGSNHIDSLTATYEIDYVNTQNYLVDFKTTSTGWCAFVIDSLQSAALTSTTSAWGLGYDARMQISRTTNGQKIVYSWADSDPAVTTTPHANELPNIFMKGYDVVSNQFTSTKDMTSTKMGPNYNSFWHLTSPIIINTSPSNWAVPTIYTSSDDGSLANANPVSYYYMDDNTFTSSDFSLAPVVGSCPAITTSIKKNETNIEAFVLYPNPALNSATIDVNLHYASKMDISIINSVGQTVYSNSILGNAGSNKLNVDLSSLSSGLYFYQVKIENGKAITKKFAVEK